MLHKDYKRKSSVENFSGREPQGAWRQYAVTGVKPSAVK
jgi:hypothetical protein